MRSKLLLVALAAGLLSAGASPASANGLSSDRDGDGHDLWLGGDHDATPDVSCLDDRDGSHDWSDDREDGGDDHAGWDGKDDGWDHEGGHGGSGWDEHPGDGGWHGGDDRDCKPVPEPGSVLLVALGLAGLARTRMR